MRKRVAAHILALVHTKKGADLFWRAAGCQTQSCSKRRKDLRCRHRCLLSTPLQTKETHAGVNPAYCKLKVSPFTDVAFPKRAVEVPRNCTLRHVVRQLLGSRNGSQRGKAGLVFACEWPSNSVKLFWTRSWPPPVCRRFAHSPAASDLLERNSKCLPKRTLPSICVQS